MVIKEQNIKVCNKSFKIKYIKVNIFKKHFLMKF